MTFPHFGLCDCGLSSEVFGKECAEVLSLNPLDHVEGGMRILIRLFLESLKINSGKVLSTVFDTSNFSEWTTDYWNEVVGIV